MNNHSREPKAEQACPYCGGLMNEGFLFSSKEVLWKDGDPSIMKELLPVGEIVGQESTLFHSTLIGYRCNACEVLIVSSERRHA